MVAVRHEKGRREMLESIKNVVVRVYAAAGAWLIVGFTVGAVVGVTLACIFARSQAGKISAAVCGLSMLLTSVILCAARLSGVSAGVVVLTALSVASLLFALWLGGWACGEVKCLTKEKRSKNKKVTLDALREKLEKPIVEKPLKPFVMPARVGERAREPLSPLLAVPKEEEGDDEKDSFGREHAKRLIALLRSAPLSPADAREVDFAERTVLGAREEDCAAVSCALSTLVRLVARYGV